MEKPIALEIRNAVKFFGEAHAVDGVSLAVPRGCFLSLVGPSGCGKTTLLRIIAGFEKADSGHVLIDGKDVSEFAPAERSVKTVYQNAALLPHAGVLANIVVVLRARKMPHERKTARGVKTVTVRMSRREAEERARRALALAGVSEDLFKRRASVLSGGEAKRVAIARALAFSPDILLLDEALSSLDAISREKLRRTLTELKEQTDVTAVYVTHDAEEALALGDLLAVMDEGKIIQIGTPQEVYDNPVNSVAAALTGECGILRSAAKDGKADFSPFGCADAQGFSDGESVETAVRPEHVKLTDGDNASVNECVTAGTLYRLTLNARCGTLIAYSLKQLTEGSAVGAELTAPLKAMRAAHNDRK